MTWIDKKHQMDTTGGVLRKPRPLVEPVFTVNETAAMLKVDRQTVMKWLQTDETGAGIIPRTGWFRLPVSRQIRIKLSAIRRVMNG